MPRFKKGTQFEAPNRFLLYSVFFFTFLMISLIPSFAKAEDPLLEDRRQRFEQLQIRIAELENAQKNLLTQQDEILEKIKVIKIWAHHSGHRTAP